MPGIDGYELLMPVRQRAPELPVVMVTTRASAADSETAGSGAEALAKLAAANPDIITVDLNTPGMDGLTLIEKIMRDDPRPIVVVTGLDARERDLAVAATERGALGLVNKWLHERGLRGRRAYDHGQRPS